MTIKMLNAAIANMNQFAATKLNAAKIKVDIAYNGDGHRAHKNGNENPAEELLLIHDFFSSKNKRKSVATGAAPSCRNIVITWPR